MDNLQLDAALHTGMAEVDEQHRHLVAIAQGLMESLRAGASQAQLKDVVNRLRHYSVAHFAAETRLMHETHFPGRDEHIEEHRKLASLARTFQDDFYRQRQVSADDVRRFMKGWLFEHILKWDMRLAEHVQSVRNGTFQPPEATPRQPDATA